MHMLPATKAIPKEMLPIVDKPMIQYIVDEIVAAGIKEIVLVTHASKNAVENHFDTSYELESLLEQRVKRQLLAEVQSICPPGVTIMNVRQAQLLGLGSFNSLCSPQLLGITLSSSYYLMWFLILRARIRCATTWLPWLLVLMKPGVVRCWLSVWKAICLSTLLFRPKSLLDNEGKVSRIVEFIEKPDQPQTLDSDLMAVGRYVLSADIWAELEHTQPGAWGAYSVDGCYC
ncbi:UTP--glucose-1-phosphate uridylyltransferase subunit GalF [Citrobacter braakii]|nr:UTP--glucose-1-phosphate uridylyltransferase subunit GalF [Citrobacter braakii]